MERINFVNNQAPALNATNLNQMQDNIENAIRTKYMLVTISGTPEIHSNYEVVFDTVIHNNTSCTLENGKIRIGSGINKIRTSSSIFVDNWAMGTSYLWGIIRKNSENICGSIESSTCACLSCTNATMIADTREGDLIGLLADSPTGGVLRAGYSNTFLLLEVVE